MPSAELTSSPPQTASTDVSGANPIPVFPRAKRIEFENRSVLSWFKK